MDIKIPSKISQFDLYRLSKNVIENYNLDTVNLYKFPIDVFNKIAEVSDIEVNQEYNEKITNVFVNKGSVRSVKELLRVLNIDSYVSIEILPDNGGYLLNVNIEEIKDIRFTQYLEDCVNYLIFYTDILITIEKLIQDLDIEFNIGITYNLLDVLFHLEVTETEDNIKEEEIDKWADGTNGIFKYPVDFDLQSFDIMFLTPKLHEDTYNPSLPKLEVTKKLNDFEYNQGMSVKGLDILFLK